MDVGEKGAVTWSAKGSRSCIGNPFSAFIALLEFRIIVSLTCIIHIMTTTTIASRPSMVSCCYMFWEDALCILYPLFTSQILSHYCPLDL